MTKLVRKAADSAGMALPKIPKIKTMPKSLGLCVDKYHEARERRLEIKRLMDEAKEEETRIFDHIMNSIPKGDGGAVGKKFKAVRTEKTSFSIDDDTEFYAFIKKTGSFDLLNRAINQKAVAERMEDAKFIKKYPKGVPGTKDYKVFGLSVTKV